MDKIWQLMIERNEISPKIKRQLNTAFNRFQRSNFLKRNKEYKDVFESRDKAGTFLIDQFKMFLEMSGNCSFHEETLNSLTEKLNNFNVPGRDDNAQFKKDRYAIIAFAKAVLKFKNWCD